jgi:3-oxoacyl-[acyl-carrier protein] reductase
MDDQRGRFVLVTGATRGVGRLIAGHFLARGATVVGLARSKATLEDEKYLHFQVDLADPVAVQNVFTSIRKAVTTIDTVINNAAVLTSQYAMIMPIGAAQEMVNINLLAPFIVAREAAKLMRKQQWGRIIQISSMAVALEPAGDSVYAACKAGSATLANVMAKEFGPFNVTCNTLCISAIESDMLAQLPRHKIDAIIAALPIPRYAKPDDILNVIDFFASSRSSYITGQTVYLGGVH